MWPIRCQYFPAHAHLAGLVYHHHALQTRALRRIEQVELLCEVAAGVRPQRDVQLAAETPVLAEGLPCYVLSAHCADVCTHLSVLIQHLCTLGLSVEQATTWQPPATAANLSRLLAKDASRSRAAGSQSPA